MSSKKKDPISGDPFYFVKQSQFNGLDLKTLPVDFSNIPMNAAYHHNLGTVMLTTDGTNVLFEGKKHADIIDLARSQGLYDGPGLDKMPNKFTVIQDFGGGHFYAILSNKTHYLYSNLGPVEGEQKSVMKFAKILLTQETPKKPCELEHKSDNESFAFHEGVPSYKSYDDDFSIFYNIMLNMGDSVLGKNSFDFIINNTQFEEAVKQVKILHEQCQSREILFTALPPHNQSELTNCLISINSISKAIDLPVLPAEFFLSNQLYISDNPLDEQFYNFAYRNKKGTGYTVGDATKDLFSSFFTNWVLPSALIAPFFAGNKGAYFVGVFSKAMHIAYQFLTKDEVVQDDFNEIFFVKNCSVDDETQELYIDPGSEKLCILDKWGLKENVTLVSEGAYKRVYVNVDTHNETQEVHVLYSTAASLELLGYGGGSYFEDYSEDTTTFLGGLSDALTGMLGFFNEA